MASLSQEQQNIKSTLGSTPELSVEAFDALFKQYASRSDALQQTKRAYDNLVPHVSNVAITDPFLRGAIPIFASPGSHTTRDAKYTVTYFIIHRPDLPGGGTRAKDIIAKFVNSPNLNSTKNVKEDKVETASHFMIALDGQLYQFVPLTDKANHIATVDGSKVFNSNSLGVELEGGVGEAFSRPQLFKLALLLAQLRDCNGAYNISIPIDRAHIIGHSEINAYRPKDSGTKLDPGDNFPYEAVISLANKIAPLDFPDEVLQPPVDPNASNIDIAAVAAALSQASNNFNSALLYTACGSLQSSDRALDVVNTTRADYSAKAIDSTDAAITYLARQKAWMYTGFNAANEQPLELKNALDVLLDFND